MGAAAYVLMKASGADPFAVLSDCAEVLWASQPGVDTMLVCPTPKALALRCLPITGRWVAGSRPDVLKLCADARESGVKTLGQVLAKGKRRVKLDHVAGGGARKRRATTEGATRGLRTGTSAAAEAKRKVTPEVLAKVAEYRSQGIAWKLVGQSLKMNPETLKKAHARAGTVGYGPLENGSQSQS